MSQLPLSVAKKLLMLSKGQTLPASSFNASWLALFENEDVLKLQRQGRTRATLVLASPMQLEAFLLNKYAIRDLQNYVDAIGEGDLSGHEAHDIAGDSKLRTRRTFKGFLIHAIHPVEAELNGKPFTLISHDGSFAFIYDFEHFRLPANVTLVGVENPENFRHIARQKHFFPENSVFVSRYPYSSDLRTWLESIPNTYIHFGDIDLAGIAIFEYEYKSLLKSRARFFIPDRIEKLLFQRGSRNLYNQQYQKYKGLESSSPELNELIILIHRLKKGLEQEALLI